MNQLKFLKMNKYFFRDLDHRDNLENGIEWHPCGAVIDDNGTNSSGKELVVMFYNPFKDQVCRQWRKKDEVELMEVDDVTFEEFVGRINKMDYPRLECLELLRDLAELQNGPPLIRYEKEWNETMEKVWEFLNKHQ